MLEYKWISYPERLPHHYFVPQRFSDHRWVSLLVSYAFSPPCSFFYRFAHVTAYVSTCRFNFYLSDFFFYKFEIEGSNKNIFKFDTN